MSSSATGATIRVRDGDGTIGDQSRAAQTVLTVRLTANPAIIASGTTATLRIPATVIDRAGYSPARQT